MIQLAQIFYFGAREKSLKGLLVDQLVGKSGFVHASRMNLFFQASFGQETIDENRLCLSIAVATAFQR